MFDHTELITESNSILVDKFKTLNQDDQLEILIECTSLTSIIEGSSGVSYPCYEIIIENNLSSKKVKDIIKNYQLQPFIVNDVITGIYDCTITPDSAVNNEFYKNFLNEVHSYNTSDINKEKDIDFKNCKLYDTSTNVLNFTIGFKIEEIRKSPDNINKNLVNKRFVFWVKKTIQNDDLQLHINTYGKDFVETTLLHKEKIKSLYQELIDNFKNFN